MKDTDNYATPYTDEDSRPLPAWGLPRDITPRLGAGLIQQGNQLHFLSDRAGLVGTFSPNDLKALDRAFPVLIKQLEACLRSGELDQRLPALRHGAARRFYLPG
nr:type IV toxin-antitoxin system YeeU family antitoxin [Serratia fonticola]